MDTILSPSISILIHSFVLSTFITFTYANELTLQGKLGGEPVLQFSSVDREIKLICDLNGVQVTNSTLPRWSFMQKGSVVVPDVALSCKGKRSSSSKDTSPVLTGCDVDFDEKKSRLVLELDDINENEFGVYVCHTGNMSRLNITFQLKELVHLTRKGANGKVQKSVTVTVGDTLQIYCNVTGLQPNKHVISWLRDGEDITQQLDDGTGIFGNFSRSNNLTFTGTASLEHRGNYTCQISLDSKDSDDELIRHYFPVQFSFFVRVKEWDVWKLPVYILVGECLLIGVFTLIINWREKRMGEDAVLFDESDDEDDLPNATSGNGTQNNNSNGKST